MQSGSIEKSLEGSYDTLGMVDLVVGPEGVKGCMIEVAGESSEPEAAEALAGGHVAEEADTLSAGGS